MAVSHNIHFLPMLLFERFKALNRDFNQADYLEKFRALKTNENRVNYVYKDLRKYNLFPKLMKDSKEDGTAVVYREHGNKMFVSSDYKEALIFYTRSILTAKSKAILALAYANRSACLYKLDMYNECLDDITRALNNNYPSQLKQKLIDRRANAEKLVKAPEQFHEQVPHIPNTQKNQAIQCAKDCLKIEKNEKFGRHVVATRDIQIGEVISVEDPFTCALISDRLIHCHHCMKLCYNLIPCNTCTMALYCNEDCRMQAFNTYHKYECSIILTLVAIGIYPVEIVAMKTATLAKDDYYRIETVGLDQEDSYQSDRYREIHNLMSGTEKRPLQNLYGKAVVAAVIFHFFKHHTKFFYGVNGEANKRCFKEVILLQLQIADLNELGIYETLKSDIREGQTFAIGLYAFSSLFNHSCSANVEAFEYGATMVIRAIKTIEEGQQCFLSYGLTYDVFSKEVRQEMLSSQYFFKCDCQACEQNWTQWDDILQFARPLFVDLRISQLDVILFQLEIAAGQVAAATRFSQLLIPSLRRCEQMEPWGNALKIRELLESCYRVFANKRRV